jgi:hypothetical protein
MSFDWSQYLRLAEELAGQGTAPSSPEAKLRSSVSRSYYAAYCTARNHLRDVDGLVIPRDDAHKFVREAFANSADTSRKQVGADLDRLRIDRNKTDYDDMDLMAGMRGLPLTTALALLLSKQIISDVAAL